MHGNGMVHPGLGCSGLFCGGTQGSLFDLVWATLGESDREPAEGVVIGGLDGDIGLDQSLPLANRGSELVGGEVETVEVGQAVLALGLIDTELDLAESVVLVLLEVGEGGLDDAALEGVVGVLNTGGPVDKSLADISSLERGCCLDVVPVLLGERILGSLLEAPLSLWRGACSFRQPYLRLVTCSRS